MRSRWLSTFTLVGLVLLALGVFALVSSMTGHPFVFDPGQPPPDAGPDYTPWYYVAIGALMVVNGLVTPAALPDEAEAERRKKRRTKVSDAVPTTNQDTPDRS